MKAKNIKWETDGQRVDLPSEMHIPKKFLEEGEIDVDSVSDWLSDETGWLHDGFEIVYTWDDLYVRADGKACCEPELKAKDNARWQVRNFAMEYGKPDLEKEECPEDFIEDYCKVFGIWFDEDGNIIETKMNHTL